MLIYRPPSRPRTRSRGGDDGYLHEEVDIAPDGENGNDLVRKALMMNLNLIRALPKTKKL